MSCDAGDGGCPHGACAHAGRAQWLYWKWMQRRGCWTAEPGRLELPDLARRILRVRKSTRILQRSVSSHRSKKLVFHRDSIEAYPAYKM
jgi:hypothetical protein